MRKKPNKPDESCFDPDAPLEVPIRYLHEGCSKHGDKTLSVTRIQTGWVFKCHRCEMRGIKTLDGANARTVAKFATDLITPPAPITTEVKLPTPDEPEAITVALAEAWLSKAGLTFKDFNDYKLYYSGGRLVFPIFDTKVGDPIFWQSRGFRAGEEKWLNQKLHGRGSIFFEPLQQPGTNYVCLVEDMISGIKVGRVANCIGLLGSYIPDKLILDLDKQYSCIIIWLDADKLSYAFLNRVKRYQQFGLNVKGIYTKQDPKCYPETEIKNFVEEVMHV